MKNSPFSSMWYIWGGTKRKTEELIQFWNERQNHAKPKCHLAQSKSALRDLRQKYLTMKWCLLCRYCILNNSPSMACHSRHRPFSNLVRSQKEMVMLMLYIVQFQSGFACYIGIFEFNDIRFPMMNRKSESWLSCAFHDCITIPFIWSLIYYYQWERY